MSQPFYNRMDVAELRKLARSRGLAGVWVACARKPKLVAALLCLDSGESSARVQERFARNTSAEASTSATAEASASESASDEAEEASEPESEPKSEPQSDLLARDPFGALRTWIKTQACDERRVRTIAAEAVRSAAIDKEALRKAVTTIVDEALAALPPMRIEVGDAPAFDAKSEHPMFPRLLAHFAARNRVWIAGPAGSGKTTAAERAAKALGYAAFLVPPQMTRYDVLGYKDAASNVVLTEFSKWAAHEGNAVLILDEVDSWHDGAALAANTALANGVCVLPDGPINIADPVGVGASWVKLVVATANTFGLGPTAQYVGRRKMDAAFRNRFEAKLYWPVDARLESALAISAARNDDERTLIAGFVARVQTARRHVESKGIEIVISPRQTLGGVRMLLAGDTEANVWAEVMTGDATEQQRADVLRAAGVA